MRCKCGDYIPNSQTICEKCKERRNTKSVHKYLKEGNYGRLFNGGTVEAADKLEERH